MNAANDTTKIQVGLLLCDDVDEADHARYGTYADMFRSIRNADPNLILTPIRWYQGEMPASPDDYDAYLISGSRHGVYDPLPWIGQLQNFVRHCRERRKKTVGICFGHQLIAQALGGEARKSDAGWGFGIQSTRIIEPQAWMDNTGNGEAQPAQPRQPHTPAHYHLVVIHQDQVVALPPRFRVIAENDFCPVSMFVDDGVMLGIQGHPEFSRAFCALRADARKAIIGDALHQKALASLAEMPLDSERVMGWVARFLGR